MPKERRAVAPRSMRFWAARAAPSVVPPPIATGWPRRAAMRASDAMPTIIASMGWLYRIWWTWGGGVEIAYSTRAI